MTNIQEIVDKNEKKRTKLKTVRRKSQVIFGESGRFLFFTNQNKEQSVIIFCDEKCTKNLKV